MKFKLHHVETRDKAIVLFFEAVEVFFCPIQKLYIPIGVNPQIDSLLHLSQIPEEIQNMEFDANIITVPLPQTMVRTVNKKQIYYNSIQVFVPFVCDNTCDKDQSHPIYYLGTPQQLAFQKIKRMGLVPLNETKLI